MNAIIPSPVRGVLVQTPMPGILVDAGPAAAFAWDEWYSGTIRNPHTRKAYAKAVKDFFNWLPTTIRITEITPGIVGQYFGQHPGSVPSRKLALAAIRACFDVLVQRHVMILNPAASVRGERYQVIEGKTPEISVEQARTLLASIDTTSLAGKRDHAIIGILIYTGARVGAVCSLLVKNFQFDGTQWLLRFEQEKGGKSREIPCRHDLQEFILDYIKHAQLENAPKDTPLFQTFHGRTGVLTGMSMTGVDINRMMKRRLKYAGLPDRLSPHSCRVLVITDLLSQSTPLESVQYLVGHSDPRTTRLYDRRQRKVSRNIVERISI